MPGFLFGNNAQEAFCINSCTMKGNNGENMRSLLHFMICIAAFGILLAKQYKKRRFFCINICGVLRMVFFFNILYNKGTEMKRRVCFAGRFHHSS